MSTLFCKWPPDDEAKAQAYTDECSAQNPDTGSPWALPREDQNGNWTVPLLGPPWEFVVGVPVPEPASCLALRLDAVVVATPEWPVEE